MPRIEFDQECSACDERCYYHDGNSLFNAEYCEHEAVRIKSDWPKHPRQIKIEPNKSFPKWCPLEDANE
jgi:hypothetical protein